MVGIAASFLAVIVLLLVGCQSAAAPAAAPAPAQPAPAAPAPQPQPAVSAPAKPVAPPSAPAAAPAKPAAQPAAVPAKPSAPGAATRLMWSATSSTSAQYAYGVAVAKVIRQAFPEVEITVSESGGADQNIKRMQKGESDIGHITSEAAAQAYAAIDQFKDQPYKDLRMLWYFQQSVFHFVVSEQSGVKSLRELDGKDFNPGLKGSSSEKTAEKVLAGLGVKPKYYRGDNQDALQAIRDRRITGYVKAGAPPDPTVLDLQVNVPIRILSFTKEDLEIVKKVAPTVATVDIPANTYRGVPAFSTFSTGLGVGVDKKLSADIAYKMLKGMQGGSEEIALAYKPVKDANIPQITLTIARTPLHEGAARYYRELGQTVPEAARPLEGSR